MDKRTPQIFNPALYRAMLERFAIDPAGVEALKGFESFIYKFDKDGRRYILRISHSLHNPPARTQGEVEFLAYLAANGLAVPHPQPSALGRLVEVLAAPPHASLPETSYFAGVVFDFAPGRPPARPDWKPDLFREMGRFLGRLHSLSRAYVPPRPEHRRHFWWEDEEDYAARFLPAGHELVGEKFTALVARLKALPQDPDSFGLCHIDFHGGNFFIERRAGQPPQITLFDFDDCAYAPFVYDLAMALFYVVPHRCTAPADLENAQTFYNTLLQGYFETYPHLDRAWLEWVPEFLKLREFDLYIILHRSADLADLSPWAASFMEDRRQRLEQDLPYLEIDFNPSL